ncbi:hypothetical protein CDD80_2955 [Ophiocordyceps camponoti-rufipedis]|uniref:DUF7892 domain-containing protein n=1 Tax=Ophiocordyceps camponoti-rufipedis TaxID=2004952 RepID=A0A2C5Z5I2_9HYPO|nr:hypothetical protein CDD80_2955 [Ophiocordyceps camponoti-rufipedis]
MVACGNCLSGAVVKEADLLFSSTPMFLLAGLSVVFLSSDLHVIPHQVLSSCKDPLHAHVIKVFLPEQAKAIAAEFEAVNSLGIATKDGWLLGLEARGKIAFADYARWDKWLVSGGVHKMRTCLQSSHLSPNKASSATAGVAPVVRLPPVSPHAALVVLAPELKSAAQGSPAVSHAQTAGTSDKNPPAIEASKSQNAATTSGASPQVIDKSKAKPEVADKSKTKGGSASQVAASTSVQPTLASLADDVIRSWNGGQKVSKALAPEFAATVMIEVRKRFLANLAPGSGCAQVLTLKDMQWIAEKKISKYTHPHENIFWCNGCPPERVATFKIQGVIQHYADKHTSEPVVQWSAEWTDTPPFDPHPSRRVLSIAVPKAEQPKKAPEKKANTAPSSAQSVPQSNAAQPQQPPPAPSGRNKLPPADKEARSQYIKRLNFMADSCKDIWDRMEKVTQLHDAAKAFLLVHYIVREVESKFSDQARIDIFYDGLSNERKMQGPRSLRCLHCRACGSTSEDKKPFSLLQLVGHFRARHDDSLDWRVDMMSPPDGRVSFDLMQSLAKNPAVLVLAADALPHFLGASSGPSSQRFASAGDVGFSSYAGSTSAGFDLPRLELQPARFVYSRWDQVERFPYGDRSREPMMRDGGSGAHVGALVPFGQRHVGPDDAGRLMAYARPDRQPPREHVSHRRCSDQAVDAFQTVDVRGRGQMDYLVPRLPPAGVVQRGHVAQPGAEWRRDKEEYYPRYPAANHGRGRVRDSSA